MQLRKLEKTNATVNSAMSTMAHCFARLDKESFSNRSVKMFYGCYADFYIMLYKEFNGWDATNALIESVLTRFENLMEKHEIKSYPNGWSECSDRIAFGIA